MSNTSQLERQIAEARERNTQLAAQNNELRNGYMQNRVRNDALATNTLSTFRGKALGQDFNDPDQNVYKTMGQFLFDIKRIGCGERTGSTNDRMTAYAGQYQSKIDETTNKFFGNEVTAKAFPTGYNEMVMSDGGALIPPQFVNEILMRTYDNDLLERVRLFNQLSSNILRIPAVNEISRVDGSRFGGITSYWTEEAATQTESKGAFKTIDLKVNKLLVNARMTDELLEDSGFSLDSYLGTIVAEEFKFKLGDALVNGDGVGKPQGMLFSQGPKVSTAKENGQIAATITQNNIYDMWARLWLGCKQNAVWLVHSTCWPQLFRLTQGNFPIALYQNMISGKPISTLLGRPLIETEFNAAVGTEGDIILVDPSHILMASKGNMRTFTSMHVYFITGEHAFRFQMRVDAKNWWTQSLTQYKSTVKVSSVVTLAARS